MQKTSQICHCKKTAQVIRPTGRTLTRNCAFNCSLELCILHIVRIVHIVHIEGIVLSP